MFLQEFLHGLLEDRRDPGAVYSHIAAVVRRQTRADVALVAFHDAASPVRWLAYTHEGPTALHGAMVSSHASMQFLDRVRMAQEPLFGTIEVRRLDGSTSFGKQDIRHAVGAPIRALGRTLSESFCGVLAIDRRGDRPEFDPHLIELLPTLALEVSLAVKAIEEHKPPVASTRSGESDLLAQVMAAVEKADGNLRHALLHHGPRGLSYDSARRLLEKANKLIWMKSLRKRRYPSSEGIGDLIVATRDLRVVGARLGCDFTRLNDRVRNSGHRSLRELVRQRNLEWDAVHGPEFQRGDPPPECV
ncbi:MAG: hypothetical protein OMOMHJEC_02447 [Xanthomonadales bacterium]|nr:hypothetical protein [Xanthomonadales bacterium]